VVARRVRKRRFQGNSSPVPWPASRLSGVPRLRRAREGGPRPPSTGKRVKSVDIHFPSHGPRGSGDVRQTRLQNSTKSYDNVGLVVDKWLEALPADKRAKLLADFNPEKYLTPELRTAMQQAKVDLTSTKPVLEQVDVKSWFGCVDTALIQKAVAARSFDEAGGTAVSAERRIGAVPHTSLTLRLHKVHCVDQDHSGGGRMGVT